MATNGEHPLAGPNEVHDVVHAEPVTRVVTDHDVEYWVDNVDCPYDIQISDNIPDEVAGEFYQKADELIQEAWNEALLVFGQYVGQQVKFPVSN